MVLFNLFTTISIVFSVLLPQVSPRKFDVESESLRLYHADLASILRQFRRSTDYMVLLQEKWHELQLFYGEVASHAVQYMAANRLHKRISDMCGVVEPAPVALRYDEAAYRRSGEEVGGDYPSTRSPAAMLDHYVHDRGVLSVHERNKIRDMAFEAAGQTIHMIIKGMGPIGLSPKSTRLPFGGDNGEVVTTTEKDHRHTISTVMGQFDFQTSTSPAPRPTVPEETVIDETMRKYQPR